MSSLYLTSLLILAGDIEENPGPRNEKEKGRTFF